MNCVVTAGPTCEPLDEVRRLTNVSTGRLGISLANHLTACGHRVTLLLGELATWTGDRRSEPIVRFQSTEDLRSRLESLAGQEVHAVFHAAAVSDFRFGRILERAADGALTEVTAAKIPTRGRNLLAELIATPKLISRVREWFPQAVIVGWKYELDGTRPAVVAAGESQMAEYRTNACVVNGRAYGPGYGVVTGPGSCRHCDDLPALLRALEGLLRPA